jgi:hypothetical protein
VSATLAQARGLASVAGFLGSALAAAKLCDDDGLFRYLGAWLARGGPARVEPRRLLVRVFGVAAVTTAVLSLDAAVVLLGGGGSGSSPDSACSPSFPRSGSARVCLWLVLRA